MQPAVFSLERYSFDKINIDYENYIDNNMVVSFSLKGQFDAENSSYELQLLANVHHDDNQEISFASINCTGHYKFREKLSLEDIPDYFYQNSVAILFPYIRAYLSIVTTQSQLSAVILPTLNLTELGPELKNHTTLK